MFYMPNCLCIARTAHPMYEIFVVQNWSQDKFSCRIAKNMENAENARGTCAWLKKMQKSPHRTKHNNEFCITIICKVFEQTT